MIVLTFRKKKKRNKKKKGRRNLFGVAKFLSSFVFFFNTERVFLKRVPNQRELLAIEARSETLSLTGRLFPRGVCKAEFRKGRMLTELPSVRCRRRVATVVSSNARPASGLPVPSPSSRPSGTNYTQFTDLCYYHTVFHPLRPVLFIHPLASPFFSELRYFLEAQKGSAKLLTDAAKQDFSFEPFGIRRSLLKSC